MKRGVILALLLVAGPAWALNPPPAVEPQHTSRVLVTAGALYHRGFSLEPIGLVYQVSLAPTQVLAAQDGTTEVRAPRWYAHVGLLGGVGYAPDLGVQGVVSLGLLARLALPLTSVGLVGAFAYPMKTAGPLVRLEVLDNLGLQGGMLLDVTGSREVYAFVSVDYLYALFEDLGLK